MVSEFTVDWKAECGRLNPVHLMMLAKIPVLTENETKMY